MPIRLFVLCLFFLVLSGCGTVPGKSDVTGFSPAEAILNTPAYKGRDVVWGGTLIATTNARRETLLEVLAYPVVNGRLQTSRSSQGRILAKVPGFLDPVDYAPGKRVIVEGLFTGVKHGYVDGATTTYAIVEARKAIIGKGGGDYQWPANLHIGIGVFKRL